MKSEKWSRVSFLCHGCVGCFEHLAVHPHGASRRRNVCFCRSGEHCAPNQCYGQFTREISYKTSEAICPSATSSSFDKANRRTAIKTPRVEKSYCSRIAIMDSWTIHMYNMCTIRAGYITYSYVSIVTSATVYSNDRTIYQVSPFFSAQMSACVIIIAISDGVLF